MAYIKDIGTPGANNAELPIGAVLDTGAKTLSLEASTKIQSAVVLEEKQWIVLETRNINGTANLTGECIYSEDATDLADVLTFINDVHTRMIALHTTFSIEATHYRLGNMIDIYRGNEATAATLEAVDTNITFAPPALWDIDDLTPFAPPIAEVSANIIIDPGCDNPTEWTLSGGWEMTGSKLIASNLNGDVVKANVSEAFIEGAFYDLTIDSESFTKGNFRFQLGSKSADSFDSGTGTITKRIECPADATTANIQAVNDLTATFDNFTCVRG